MRYLSSYLKLKGHTVKLVFFPYENPFAKEDAEVKLEKQEQLFSDLLSVCRNYDLDQYPPMNFTIEDKWVLSEDSLVRLTPEKQKELFAQKHLNLKDGSTCYAYVTQASRGYPHKCAYCSNSLFLEKFKGKGKALRR